MFSFHKPKVYRSSTGCCICKAKSSSSRFTDSKKYEDDFVECFQLQERRTGEICNACVLLVKRWKKLPPGSDRNWRHVVDARAGPGIKSLTKFKSKNKKKMKDKIDKSDKIVKKKHVYSKDMKMEIDREQSPARSDDMSEYYNVIRPDSKNSSRSESPMDSDDIIEKPLDVAPVECAVTKENIQDHVNDFIDLSYFKRQDTCCGPIFKGLYGEVIVDAALFKPCVSCSEAKRQRRQISDSSSASETTSPIHSASTSPAHSVESLPSSSETSISKQTQVSKNNTFSDSSSDSGYDEYSNQGADGGKKNIQKIKVLPSSNKQIDEISHNSLTGATNVTVSSLQVPQSVSSN